MTQRETRGGNAAQIRSENGTVKVSGYAAVFNQVADIGGYFNEVIAPGAFRDAIGRDDVVFLINHEGLPLARTRSGTLILKEDEKGLYMEADLLLRDPDVQAIEPKMQRGDLDKMSFAFLPEKGGEDWDDTGDVPLRKIKRVNLFDVSVVTTPAFDGTSIALRSLEACRNVTRRQQNFSAAARRLAGKINLDLRVRENG